MQISSYSLTYWSQCYVKPNFRKAKFCFVHTVSMVFRKFYNSFVVSELFRLLFLLQNSFRIFQVLHLNPFLNPFTLSPVRPFVCLSCSTKKLHTSFSFKNKFTKLTQNINKRFMSTSACLSQFLASF